MMNEYKEIEVSGQAILKASLCLTVDYKWVSI